MLMASPRKLPLFPLNTVLFPGDDIPLQVFEERYALLIKDCMAGDRRFGVVLIKAGPEVGGTAETHTVGTVARIVQVTDIGEGRSFVSAHGEERFRLLSRHDDRPYPVGEVQLLEDGPQHGGDPERREEAGHLASEEAANGELASVASLVRSTAGDLLSLVMGMSGGWTGDPSLPHDPTALSYYVPKLLRIDLTERQQLLETATTADRLGVEALMLQARVDALKARVSARLRGRFGRN